MDFLARTETLEVNGARYLVKVHFEERKNSSVSIGRKTVNIRIPVFLNREEKFRQLLELKRLAKNKLSEEPEKFKPEEEKTYLDGETLKIGEDEYALNIVFKGKQSSSARLSGKTIRFSISAQLAKEEQNRHVSALLSRIIAKQRLPKLKQKISELNEKHFNQKINKIFFKHNKTSWGSCSSQGNINISTRLLFAPDDVLEYVCVHELAHLVEQNHSGRFWALVEKAMPEYKTKTEWLKQNAGKCKF